MDELPEIKEEKDLVEALKKPGRFLLYDVVGVRYEDGETGEEEAYSVHEKHRYKEERIAWVDFDLGEKWTKGRDANGPYCGGWHLPEFSGFKEWTECGSEFKKGDTINWLDGVWDRSGAKPQCLGLLDNVGVVTGESADGEWVWVRVEQSNIFEDDWKDGRVHPLKVGLGIKRARRTVVHRMCRRLLREGEQSDRTCLA